MKFPKGFLWGTAMAAHQIEGDNKNSDWWIWENSKKKDQKYPLEASKEACYSYYRYKEDFDLCKELNNNAVRISVEWARLEPNEGEFSQREFDHYKEVLKAAKERGLKTFVTLHHFTNPMWFSKKGDWANFKAPKLFARYAKKCAQEFGDLIDFYATINEPQVYVMMGYWNGTWPPNKRNPFLSLSTQIIMILSHRKAYKEIKSVNPNFQVGIIKHIVWYEPVDHLFKFVDYISASILNFANNELFLKPLRGTLDYIGLNYYFHTKLKFLKTKNPNDVVSDMGWWVSEKGLEEVIVNLKQYKVPIYVTENGAADAEDRIREKLLKKMITACGNAIKRGADLRGYFHWSLIDNFEWHQGFWPRFGLVEIDREHNLERKPRKSFYYYAKISKDNKI